MKTQRKPFNEIMDVFGFRIVVDRVDACYRVLGVVHNLYKPVAGRFKDYIAIPKANGYQSLHTTLFGMHGVPIEVQIRTRQMEVGGEQRHRRALAVQGRRSVVRGQSGARAAMGARPARSAATRRQLARVHRKPEDRPVPRRGLRVHAQGRDLRVAARRVARWTSPTRCTPTSATAASRAESTATSRR